MTSKIIIYDIRRSVNPVRSLGWHFPIPGFKGEAASLECIQKQSSLMDFVRGQYCFLYGDAQKEIEHEIQEITQRTGKEDYRKK